MQDIRHYSNKELALMVINDEWLYSFRHDRDMLLDCIKENFLFTEEQLDELIETLELNGEEI